MKTIINNVLLDSLTTEINAAIKDVADRHKVTLKAHCTTYDPSGGVATFKIAVVALGEGGEVRDVPAELFLAQAHLVGLKPEHLGKEVTISNRQFTVAGFKPKARKNCIIIRDVNNGKTFVTSAATVERQLSSK